MAERENIGKPIAGPVHRYEIERNTTLFKHMRVEGLPPVRSAYTVYTVLRKRGTLSDFRSSEDIIHEVLWDLSSSKVPNLIA